MLALGVAAGLLLVEVGLALAGVRPGWAQLDPAGWAEDHLEARYRLRPGWRGELFGASVRVNSLGGRGPEPRAPEVLVLGDSVAHGVAVPEDRTYAARLSAAGYETLNLAVPGYSAHNVLRLLESEPAAALRPRLVVAQVGWNDHGRGLAPEAAFDALRRAASSSRIAALLLRAQRLYSSPPQRRRVLRLARRVPPEAFRRSLLRIAGEARRRGAVPVFVTPPFEPRNFGLAHLGLADPAERARYAELMRQAAREAGAGLVDSDAIIPRAPERDTWRYFADFVHPNAEGHRLLAGALEPWAACARSGDCPPSEPLTAAHKMAK